jgi:hypothetical protein
MHIYLAQNDNLYDAETAEAWSARQGPTILEPETLSHWIRRLFDEDNVALPGMSPWQQHVLLFAVYTQKRCRVRSSYKASVSCGPLSGA